MKGVRTCPQSMMSYLISDFRDHLQYKLKVL